MKGLDLVDLSGKYDSAWISHYLKKEANKDGESHKRSFKGSDGDLQIPVDWLLEKID